MCGFLQVFHKNKPINKERFNEALQTISHRGPDGEGVYFDSTTNVPYESLHVGFGHKRLSILDLNHRADQPFKRKTHTLLYNGEIYNYSKLQSSLKGEFKNLHTSSDTEVLMHGLLQNGPEVFQELNGMWALSLYDSQTKQTFLSRDRYGKKPLFYYQDETTLCISSSIRAIKVYTGISLSLTQSCVQDFMLSGMAYPSDSNQTHMNQIHQILPAHHGLFDANTWKLTQAPYFNWEHPVMDPNELDLASLLARSVEERLVSDRPVGLLLSGGIDSSLILSILHHLGLHENVTVFMGETGRSDDYKFAKECADKLGISAQTIVCDYDKDSFERFLQVCHHHEKPFPFNGSALAMPQMYEQIAQNGIPVVLDGTGGDEIFGGYWQRHLPFAFKDALRNNDKNWAEAVVKQSQNSSIASFWQNAKNGKSLTLNPGQRSLYYALHPFVRIPWPTLSKAKVPDPVQTLPYSSFTKALIADVRPGGRLGDWVWHNDRNSMMYSIEGRSPFLDYRLYPFLFSGHKNKFQGEWNKLELRRLFDSFASLPTQWRSQKQGFRWDGKRFFKNNHKDILNLIGQSEALKEVLHVQAFTKACNLYPKLLRSSLGRRATCLAGLEATL
jgi:asparagine synthase (glutamine-hydrolysing)